MSIKRTLDSAGVSLQRTKTWKESNDLTSRFKKHIKELYNTDYNKFAWVICVDEFEPIEVRPCGGQNWCPKKHPDRQPVTYTRKHGVWHLIAAYNLKEDRMYSTLQKRKTNKGFLQFLKKLRCKYDSK